MSQLWHMIVRVYLLIPYSKPEAHVFLYIHNLFPWWMPGALAFGIVPVVYLIVWMSKMLFGGFKWFDYYRLKERTMLEARKYAYYAFWMVYLIWIPLPWPRAAVLIWALLLRWTIKSYLKNRKQKIMWLSSLDKADLALLEGGEKWLERQKRIDQLLQYFSIRKPRASSRD